MGVLKIIMIIIVYIVGRGVARVGLMWKQIKAGGLGAALRPPMGPGQSPGGGPGGEAPGSWRVFSISGT